MAGHDTNDDLNFSLEVSSPSRGVSSSRLVSGTRGRSKKNIPVGK